MDFIVFMSIYVVVFIITTILYYSCDAAVVKSSLYRGFISLAKFLFGLIPGFIKNNICGGFDHLFYKRNHVFQIIYGSLVLAGHVVLVLDIFPIVYTLAAHENHVTVPLILVLANTVFFNLTCSTDPGEITPASVKHFSPAYCYDMIMYKPNMKCRTCHTAKLPRSKHCSICDRCVYRFDHHCIWTNNCIGGLNHCYFILFLLSICVMSINGVFVCWNCLMLVVGHYKMLDTSYMDGAGNIQPVTVLVLAQHLFMKFPRIVFTLVSLTFVIGLLGGFTLYHIFLLLTNQTTNERYKTILPESQPQKPKPSLNGRFRRPPKPKKFDRYVYSKGFSQNLYEVIFPKSFLKDKVKDKYC